MATPRLWLQQKRSMRSTAIANALALLSMQRRDREISPRCANRAIVGSLAPRTRPWAPCHVREVCESNLANCICNVGSSVLEIGPVNGRVQLECASTHMVSAWLCKRGHIHRFEMAWGQLKEHTCANGVSPLMPSSCRCRPSDTRCLWIVGTANMFWGASRARWHLSGAAPPLGLQIAPCRTPARHCPLEAKRK